MINLDALPIEWLAALAFFAWLAYLGVRLIEGRKR